MNQPNANLAAPVRTTTSRTPFMILLVLGLLAGTGVIVLNNWGYASINPTGVWLGGLFALGYVAVFLGIFSLVRILPPRPWVWIPVSLVWGAGTGMGFVMISGDGVTNLFEQLDLPIFTASFAGAWPEEIGKGLGVLLILICMNSLNRPWHGLAVGAFVGLGFTILENIGYGASGGLLNPSSDLAGVSHIWLIRTLAGPAQHAIFTGIAGWGIGLGLFSVTKSTAWRWAVSVFFVVLGFLCHFTWNLSPSNEILNVVTMGIAALVGYSTFITLLIRARKQKKNARTAGAFTDDN